MTFSGISETVFASKIVRFPFRRRLSMQVLLVLAIGLCAILALVVFGIRVTSLLRHGDLCSTSGGDATAIYGIWKVQIGEPLYEWPFTQSLPLSPYNYFFYHFYAGVLSAFGIKGASLPVGGALATLFLAVFGAIAQWKVMHLVLRDEVARRNDSLLALLVLTAWIGTGMVGWWALTVRPDIGAVAFATAGLWAYLTASRGGQRSWILLMTASILFYLAWSFKQSTVWTVTGVCSFVLFYRRRLWHAIQLIVPCGSLMALTIWIGGTNYWENIFVGMSQNPLSVDHFVKTAPLAFLPSLFFWGFWVYALVATPVVFDHECRTDTREGLSSLILLCFVVCISLAGGLISTARVGCSRNQLFEAFMSSASLSSCLFIKYKGVQGTKGHGSLRVAAILILSMTLLPGAQLLLFNRIGRLTLASQQEYVQRKRFAECLQGVQKPLFTRDEMFSLPWLSTGGRYPAYVIPWDVYDPVLKAGLIGEGVDELIMHQRFGSVLLDERDILFKKALQAGYDYSSSAPCGGWHNLRLLSRTAESKMGSLSSINGQRAASGRLTPTVF
jgi:hypothetical protein